MLNLCGVIFLIDAKITRTGQGDKGAGCGQKPVSGTRCRFYYCCVRRMVGFLFRKWPKTAALLQRGILIKFSENCRKTNYLRYNRKN